MREKYEAMGNEMTRSLGFENKKVILFWKAFEEERWLACELHYNCFKKGLTKQSTLGIIIIESEREVGTMEKFLVWYRDGRNAHFDTFKEVFEDANYEALTETVTVEFYDNGKYVGEVDYTVEEFEKNYREWVD